MDVAQPRHRRRSLLFDVIFIVLWTSCWLLLHTYYFNLYNTTTNSHFVSGLDQPTFPRQFYLSDVAAEISHQFWNDQSWNQELDSLKMQQEIKQMFLHGYNQYLKNAFPLDALRPISCSGFNQQGGIGLTMLDSMDTFLTFGLKSEFEQAVRFATMNVSFALNRRVHVFELTIRVLGALIASHVIILNNPKTFPNYDAGLIHVAKDLADRLLPAFDTGTGIPLSWINLKHGQIKNDTRITCAACAGTLLLEFITLSRLQDDPKYENAARQAIHQLYSKKSNLNLIGNTINVDSGRWTRHDSGIGAGIDSFYEYLIKSYLMFGEQSDFIRASEAYVSVASNTQIPGTHRGFSWLVDIHMHSGQIASLYVSSLSAFWPGLQVLAGQFEQAENLLKNYTTAWQRMGWLPEKWGIGLTHIHTTERGYPLRPELLESMYVMHAYNGDKKFKRAVRSMVRQVGEKLKTGCGFASVADVESGALEDSMESFFLSETLKYAHLMFAENDAGRDLIDFFVLSTEGHLMPIFANEREFSYRLTKPVKGCEQLCSKIPTKLRIQQIQKLQKAFPLLAGSFTAQTADILRGRRCSLCNAITEKLIGINNLIDPDERARIMEIEIDGKQNDFLNQRQNANSGTCSAEVEQNSKLELQSDNQGYILCILEYSERQKTYLCSKALGIPEKILQSKLIPQNSVILQFVQLSRVIPQGTIITINSEVNNYQCTLAEFGPQIKDGIQCLEHYDLLSQLITDEYEDDDDFNIDSISSQQKTPKNDQNLILVSDLDYFCEENAVRGKLVVAEPPNACIQLQGGNYQGAVVLAQRGDCAFVEKAINIQGTGAVAMIVINNNDNAPGEETIMMTSLPKDPIPVIFSFSVSSDVGKKLIKQSQREKTTVSIVAGSLPDTFQYVDIIGQELQMLIPEPSKAWIQKNIPEIINNQKQASIFTQNLVQDPKIMEMIFQLANEGSSGSNDILNSSQLQIQFNKQFLNEQFQGSQRELLEEIFQLCYASYVDDE